MSTPTTATELLKTQQNELIKSYTEYDVQSRPFRIYTARTNAKTGDPAIVTEYIYDGVSTRVVGRKEGYTEWDESWIPDSSFSAVPEYNP